MTKKTKKVEIENTDTNENKRLTEAQYWEWRCAIADMMTSKKEKELAEAQLSIMKKDIEIATLKAKVFEIVQYERAKAKVEASVNAYEENKKRLEMVHNISLSGKIIDEVTYEIKELHD